LPSYAESDFFLAHRDRRTPDEFIGTPFVPHGSKQPVIPMSRRLVAEDGRFIGIVVACVNASYFRDFHNRLELGPDRYVALYRRDGTHLVQTERGQDSAGKADATGAIFSRNLEQAPSGLIRGRLVVNDAERIISYSQLERYPAVIAVSVTRDQALADWRRAAAGSMRVFIPALAAILLAGFVIQRQVHHRRRSGRALQESQAQLQRLVGNIPGTVFTLVMRPDGEPEFTYLSEDAERLGHPREALLNRKDGLTLLLPPQSRAAVKKHIQKLARSMAAVSEEMQFQRADGSTMWVRIAAGPYRTGAGDVAWDGVVYDITESRRWQEQSIQAQRMQAIGQLTGGVAHEFNNLLMVIEGNVTLLESHAEKDAEIADLTRRISAASRRGAEVTQRLLAFSLKQPLSPAPVDVNAIARELADLASSAMFGNAQLRLKLAENIELAMADEYQLYNAILNLLLNARDATPDGGTITISTANVDAGAGSAEPRLSPGRYVSVAVSDTGTGMTESVRRRAFEPFFTTKDVGKGAGLGLSMVHGFARQSEGAVTIESAVGGGATVTIYLPTVATARAAKADVKSPVA
jgi:PAS domain S-box-containing protein